VASIPGFAARKASTSACSTSRRASQTCNECGKTSKAIILNKAKGLGCNNCKEATLALKRGGGAAKAPISIPFPDHVLDVDRWDNGGNIVASTGGRTMRYVSNITADAVREMEFHPETLKADILRWIKDGKRGKKFLTDDASPSRGSSNHGLWICGSCGKASKAVIQSKADGRGCGACKGAATTKRRGEGVTKTPSLVQFPSNVPDTDRWDKGGGVVATPDGRTMRYVANITVDTIGDLKFHPESLKEVF